MVQGKDDLKEIIPLLNLSPKAMEKMKELMNDPKAMKEWMENKKKEFDALPDEK